MGCPGERTRQSRRRRSRSGGQRWKPSWPWPSSSSSRRSRTPSRTTPRSSPTGWSVSPPSVPSLKNPRLVEACPSPPTFEVPPHTPLRQWLCVRWLAQLHRHWLRRVATAARCRRPLRTPPPPRAPRRRRRRRRRRPSPPGFPAASGLPDQVTAFHWPAAAITRGLQLQY